MPNKRPNRRLVRFRKSKHLLLNGMKFSKWFIFLKNLIHNTNDYHFSLLNYSFLDCRFHDFNSLLFEYVGKPRINRARTICL